MERIKTLVDKEWAEAFKNKMVLGTVVFMPILFMILPLFQLALMRNIPSSESNEMPSMILAACCVKPCSKGSSPDGRKLALKPPETPANAVQIPKTGCRPAAANITPPNGMISTYPESPAQ